MGIEDEDGDFTLWVVLAPTGNSFHRYQATRGHAEFGDVLPRKTLAQGFVLNDTRVPLLGPQGIFKPAVLEVPLSITTAPSGPYDDSFGPELLRYRYRGTDPSHRDNVGLRLALEHRLPLVYFFGLMPGKYLAI